MVPAATPPQGQGWTRWLFGSVLSVLHRISLGRVWACPHSILPGSECVLIASSRVGKLLGVLSKQMLHTQASLLCHGCHGNGHIPSVAVTPLVGSCAHVRGLPEGNFVGHSSRLGWTLQLVREGRAAHPDPCELHCMSICRVDQRIGELCLSFCP